MFLQRVLAFYMGKKKVLIYISGMNKKCITLKLLTFTVLTVLFVACSESGTDANENLSSSSVGEDPLSSGAITSSSTITSSGDVGSSSSSTPVPTSSTTASALTWTVPSAPTVGTFADSSTYVHVAIADAGYTITNDNSCLLVSGTVLHITCGGTYVFTGSTTHGQIRVTADKDLDNVELVLNGVSMANTENSPIYVVSANKVKVNVPEGAVSILSDAVSYTYIDVSDSAPKACIYSKDDLTLKGNGTLYVNGNFNNGIHTSDDMNINDNLKLYVNAMNHAIKGKESVDVDGTGTFYLKTLNGDGIQADEETDVTKGFIDISAGTFLMDVGSDGLNAFNWLRVTGGSFVILAGDGTLDSTVSHAGFKSDSLIFAGGFVRANTQDDGLHGVSVNIVSGTLELSSGDDGIQAEGVLFVSGGNVNVTKSKKPVVAATGFTMNGGSWMGLGSVWDVLSLPTATTSQYTVLVALATEVVSGTEVRVETAAGVEILSATADKKVASIFVSSPDFASGTTYNVVAGTATVATFTLDASAYLVQVQGN